MAYQALYAIHRTHREFLYPCTTAEACGRFIARHCGSFLQNLQHCYQDMHYQKAQSCHCSQDSWAPGSPLFYFAPKDTVELKAHTNCLSPQKHNTHLCTRQELDHCPIFKPTAHIKTNFHPATPPCLETQQIIEILRRQTVPWVLVITMCVWDVAVFQFPSATASTDSGRDVWRWGPTSGGAQIPYSAPKRSLRVIVHTAPFV